MPRYKLSTRIAAPAAEVFEWHSRPGALERLIPPWENIQVMQRSGGLEDGARTVIRMMKGPLRLRWIAEHSEYREGESFVDKQVSGPFAAWRHAHRFLPADGDNSILEDEIDYRLPLGALSEAVAGGYVQRDIDRSFRFRHRRTADDLQRHSTYRGEPRQRIVLTGASGLIGRQLSAFLTTGGHEVRRAVRREPSTDAGEFYWDPAGGEVDAAGLNGADAVIHLSGRSISAWRWTRSIKDAILESRVASTRLLSETLAALPNPPRVLVAASAIGFYGNRGSDPIDESSGPGRGFLADVCQRWEEATEPARAAGIRVVNLRTGLVLTAAGGVLRRLLFPFRLGLGGPLGSGQQYMSWIGADDLLAIILSAVFDEKLEGPLNAVAPNAVTNHEFTRTLGAVLRRPTVFRVPAVVLRTLFGEMGQALFLHGARVTPQKLDASSFQFLHPNLESAIRWELGRSREEGGADG